MNKKTLKILISAFTVVLLAGISAGIVLRLRASDSSAYRNKVLSKGTFELNGVKMYYVEPDEEAKRRNPDRIIYKDDTDLYYYFDTDTQNIRSIDNKALDSKEYANLTAGSIKPYPDTETLFKDAKERLGKWYDGDIEKFEWNTKTDDLGNTTFEVRQLIDDEFSVLLGRAKYDMDGDFSHANFHFDAAVNLSKKNSFISKEQAIEKAKAFIEKEYGETDWEEIAVRDVTSSDKVYWEITLKKTEIITIGYYVGVDLLSGKTWLEGPMR